MMLPFFDGHCHIVSALTLARIILILQAASSHGKNSIFNMLKYLHLHLVDLGGNCNCD